MALDYLNLLKLNPSLEIFKILCTKNGDTKSMIKSRDLQLNMNYVVRSGNFDILRHIIKQSGTDYGFGFNIMH